LLQVAAIMSERAKKSDNEDEVPSIALTIINIHPSHVADARFYLRREVQTAEAAGAKIIIKVGWVTAQVVISQHFTETFKHTPFSVQNRLFQ